MTRFALTMTLTTALAATGAAALDGATHVQHTHVETIVAEGAPKQIADAGAWLQVTAAGAAMMLDTAELTPGHVITAWWVVINAPDQCGSTPCSPEDVIGGHATTKAEIAYADGVVVGDDGRARFRSFLSAGPVEDGWFGHGFTDTDTAEIHLVLNDHGPVVPELLASMLTSYRGGCTDESLPPPFPDTAKADGAPGPNACALVQDAIFVR